MLELELTLAFVLKFALLLKLAAAVLLLVLMSDNPVRCKKLLDIKTL